METYPYDSIIINSRDILIEHIVSGKATPQSDFESATFSFIREWFGDSELFSQLTSGSTGDPKEITITRRGMISSAIMTQQALNLQAGWNALVCLDPAYIAGKMMLVRSFVTGMKVIAVEPSANPFRSLSPDQPIEFTALVPYQVYDIIQSDEASRFNRLHTILIGGAPLDQETTEKLQQFECQFYATYGMTETVSHIALMPLNRKLRAEYFTVLPGITVTLDERGCLNIHGLHLPEKVITNDLAELKDNFRFKWLGRWDNVINTGGIKVIPERLESEIGLILHTLGITQNFLVSSVPDNKLGSKVVLLIEHKLSKPLERQLITELAKRVAKKEVPKQIFTGQPFTYTKSGKVDRTATTQQIVENDTHLK